MGMNADDFEAGLLARRARADMVGAIGKIAAMAVFVPAWLAFALFLWWAFVHGLMAIG